MRGIFISFEGSDGSGKSTQVKRLAQRLKEAGRPFIATREPGGTALGETIRHLLQNAREGEGMCAETELLLFAASRAQLIREVILPALEAGTTVIADRFHDSTTVYQGVARRLIPEQVAAINEFALGGLRPDATLLFDLPPEAAHGRLNGRSGDQRDRIEAQPFSFFESVRTGYLALARSEPERVAIIDANRAPDIIESDVLALLKERFHGLLP